MIEIIKIPQNEALIILPKLINYLIILVFNHRSSPTDSIRIRG